ncbi:2-(hydroxymethyl)glutarate dehydrogenase [Geodia barretti]|uniref:3-hydroxyisobutyrate dehydrogenase n=1 Tax=Geodia barretti TaxID=519541 RepID=A0AA35XCS0_GEOBA|nr:2-(hydroxymethyl)glutarate dehydrogenase [Geodia barretti]
MKVGFVGVGFMGRHMARNVLNGGHEMKVYDLNRDAADEALSLGATWANSPREAAEGSEVIFTSLPTPQVVEEVASGEGGVFSGASRGSALFDLSTTDPTTIQRIATRAEASGIELLDAPVSGGTGGAEAATLCVMVGGDRDTYDRYKPVLDLIGDKVMYCGGLGSGAVCKIVNNLVGLSVGVLLSEAFSMGVKWGVDAQTLYEAVSGSSGNTNSMHGFPNGIFRRNFEPGFALDLAAKDVGLATQLGRELRVPMEMSNIAQQRYIDGQNRGFGRMAAGAVAIVQEERAGVEIAPKQ